MKGAVPTPARSEPDARERNEYFDLLRGMALLRVVTYHTLGAWWLHVAFPAIGVMFALAGALISRSLDRRNSLRVVGSRMRRLLPPVWLYAVVAIAVGWESVGPEGSRWSRLLFWIMPLRDPHNGAPGSGIVDTLWYLRAYLWFVLLSPFLLWAFRKAQTIMLIAPLALLPVVTMAGSTRWPGRGFLTDILAYGSCWMLGFAEYDGLLQRIPAWLCGLAATTASAGGLALQLSVPGRDPTNSLTTVGFALWSAAYVLLLMRWRPDSSWLRRIPWLDRTVAVINARAVTIYLWHDPAVVMAGALLALVGLHVTGLGRLPMVLVLTAVAVFAAGWVEDLAARRRVSLLPRGALVAARAGNRLGTHRPPKIKQDADVARYPG